MSKLPITNYIGCLIGGAAGDALGAPVEFLTLQQIRNHYGQQGVTGYVEFGEGSGEFTDDTQMTLFTAEALLRAYHRAMLKGIGGALNTIAHHSYLRWLHTQGETVSCENIHHGVYDLEGWLIRQKLLYKRRAPGNTCISALESGIAGSVENPINNSKGCGTIMRMAPVGLIWPGNAEDAFKHGCDLAAITHGHPSGYLSAGFFAAVISEIAAGNKIIDAIHDVSTILKHWDHHHETLEAVNKALALAKEVYIPGVKPHPEMIKQLGAGWVAEEALAISLFASLIFEKDFRSGVLYAVNHGGDSDSTGSITGNILGLINGLESIPPEWVTNLKGNEIVATIAQDLHTGVKGDSFDMDNEWWEKYPGY